MKHCMEHCMKRFVITAILIIPGCSNPQPGPDKSVAGTVLGAGWGTAVGAVIGNQVSTQPAGMAVGAGLGAIEGLISGVSYDLTESALIDQERALDALKIQALATQRELQDLQGTLDRATPTTLNGGVYQVLFDSDVTSIRSGALADLEVLSEAIKRDPGAVQIHVVGHSDDEGSTDYNQKLADSRARAVTAYLTARGISADQIKSESFGSQRPVASNTTAEGRQLNRRVDVWVSR